MNLALIDLLIDPLEQWDGGMDDLISEVVTEPSIRDLEVLGHAVLRITGACVVLVHCGQIPSSP